MSTHAEMVEQFRAGEFVDTRGGVGAVHLKHVQALGHIEIASGEHVAYVLTVQAHPLRVPTFATAEEAQRFIEQCAEACPTKKVLA